MKIGILAPDGNYPEKMIYFLKLGAGQATGEAAAGVSSGS